MADRATIVAAWESLFRAQVAVMRSLAEEFPSEHISFNEYDVLFNVSRAPDRRLRLRELNRHVLITQPSVSRLVDRLVSRGYVSKTDDPADGRGTIVELTDAGFDVFRMVALKHMATIEKRVGSTLDDAELDELTRLCDKLRTNIPATG